MPSFVVNTAFKTFPTSQRTSDAVVEYVNESRLQGLNYHAWVGKTVVSSESPGVLFADVVHGQCDRSGLQVVFTLFAGDVFYCIYNSGEYKSSGLLSDSHSAYLMICGFISQNSFSIIIDKRIDAEKISFILKAINLPADDDSIEYKDFHISTGAAGISLKKYDEFLYPYRSLLIYTAVIIFIVTVGGWIAYDYHVERQKELAAEAELKKDPYKGVRESLTLTKVNIKIYMAQLSMDLAVISSIPGYSPIKVSGSESGVTVELTQVNGNYESLKKWASDNGFIVSFFNNNFQISKNYLRMPPLSGEVIPPPPIDGQLAYITDALSAWWDGVSVTTENSVAGKWVERLVNIQITNWTPFDFDTLGSLMNAKSLALKGVELTFDGSNYSGKITIVAYGRAK